MAERAKQAIRSQSSFGTAGRDEATSLMCDRNVIPRQFCDFSGGPGSADATDANGGAIFFELRDTAFDIVREDVPIAICQEAIPEFDTGETTRPASIEVDGSVITDISSITPITAANECDSAPIELIFTYDKR